MTSEILAIKFLEKEVESLKSKLKIAVDALEFYDGVHNKHWAIILNTIGEPARQALKEIGSRGT